MKRAVRDAVVREAASFGDVVKRRRVQKASELEKAKGVSKSRARKLVVAEEKAAKNPRWAFERKCGRLYLELLRSCKQKDGAGVAEVVGRILTEYFEDAESPIVGAAVRVQTAPTASKEAAAAKVEYVAELTRQAVSRSLQMCFKVGNAHVRETILAKCTPVFAEMATSSSGSHLCMKMLNYSIKDKTVYQQLVHSLSYKSFWTKSGARVWDFAWKKNTKLLTPFVYRLFFQRLLESEFPRTDPDAVNTDKLLALIREASTELRKTIRERSKELVDKLTLKELLGSEIAQRYLAILAIIDCSAIKGASMSQNGVTSNGAMPIGATPMFNKDDMSKLAEATFEATRVLLKTKDGVQAACRFCGYWSAKQRKTFLEESKKNLQLEELSWTDYLVNPVDGVFVVRLLATVDDTKLSTNYILGPILGVKRDKHGIIKAAGNLDKTWSQLLPLGEKQANESSAEEEQSRTVSKVLGLLAAVVQPEHMNRFVNPQQAELLRYPSPSSRKEEDLRAGELRTFLQAALRCVQSELDLTKSVAAANLKPLLGEAIFGSNDASDDEQNSDQNNDADRNRKNDHNTEDDLADEAGDSSEQESVSE